MATNILRYAGFGIEDSFATEKAADFHLDVTSLGIDSPGEPYQEYGGGLGRAENDYGYAPYVPGGGVDAGFGISALAYLLYLILGTTTKDASGVTAISDPTVESFTTGSPANDPYELSLASSPVVQGSFTLASDPSGTPSDVAEDDGFGNITELNASGITGSIDYASGTVRLSGLADTTDYGPTYSYGQYQHTIGASNSFVPVSFTLHAGKDTDEQAFLGSVMNSAEFSVEKGFATLSMDVQAANEKKNTLKTESDLKIFNERLRSFTDVTCKVGDKNGTLTDISAKVASLSLSIENNADLESFVGLGSKFPQDGAVAGLNITGSLTLQFEDFSYKEDFWGNTSGPADETTEKQLEITIDSGGATGYGKAVITLPRVRLNNVEIQPSGRDRLQQTIPFKCYEHKTEGKMIQAVIDCLNTLHDPA